MLLVFWGNKVENKKNPSVLNVEDDRINSMVINKFIDQDYECDNAFSGVEAIEMASKKIYDLVLMDISLGDPQYDGVTVMHELRKMKGYENTRFIAVTSFAMQGDKQELLKQGFDAYMSKPIYKEQLLSSMKKTLS